LYAKSSISRTIKGFQGDHSEKGGSLFVLLCHSAVGLGLFSSLLYVIPMSRPNHYVTNFESLLLKEFPSNDMSKPLNAIISVAIFSVNFPLQRKELHFTATLHISFQQQTAFFSCHLQLTEDFQLSHNFSDQRPIH